jgi:hypothetical protein
MASRPAGAAGAPAAVARVQRGCLADVRRGVEGPRRQLSDSRKRVFSTTLRGT